LLSPFLIWPLDRRRFVPAVLRSVAGVVVAASLAAGAAALRRDLGTAYLWAGPSIFSSVDQRQMASVRGALAEGEIIILFAGPDNVWHARLWQRGLYPRNPVAVQFEGEPPERLRALRERFGFRHAVLIGRPANAPRLRGERDLGPLPGLPGRVAFGELPP
jgi:hypothetical protein